MIPRHSVTIAHPCSHFSRAYALNRFLVLLILRHFNNSGLTRRMEQICVCEISSADAQHQCGPQQCYGYKHAVSFRPAACEGPAGVVTKPLEFDGLIIRVGAADPPDIYALSEAGERKCLSTTFRPVRQSLPFYAPA